MIAALRQVEHLERRDLLALAAFSVELYTEAGALISNDTVSVGDTFYVEILAQDVRENPSGLAGIGLDIDWNADVLRMVEPFSVSQVLTDRLPVLHRGTLDQARGEIDNLNGVAAIRQGVVGQYEPERFARLHFEALAPTDSTRLSLNVGRSQIAFLPPVRAGLFDFDFERQVIHVLADSQWVQEQTASMPSTTSERASTSATDAVLAARGVEESFVSYDVGWLQAVACGLAMEEERVPETDFGNISN